MVDLPGLKVRGIGGLERRIDAGIHHLCRYRVIGIDPNTPPGIDHGMEGSGIRDGRLHRLAFLLFNRGENLDLGHGPKMGP